MITTVKIELKKVDNGYIVSIGEDGSKFGEFMRKEFIFPNWSDATEFCTSTFNGSSEKMLGQLEVGAA